MQKHILGVLFDMDGVLVDSEEYICRAAIEMFNEKGLSVSPDDFVPFVGTGENRYIGGVAEKYDLPIDITQAKKRTYEIYAQLVKGKLTPLSGAAAFIDRCKSLGLKVAVASSADYVKVEINLRESGLGMERFDAIVNGLEVENKKPHPDIFLLAAQKLSIAPDRCLVAEDAPSGVKAALAAGCKCLGIMSGFEADQLAGAHWFARDLASAPNACIEW